MTRTLLHLACNSATRPSRIIKESASALRFGLVDSVIILGRAAPDHALQEVLGENIVLERVSLATAGLPRSAAFQILKLFEFQRRVRERALAIGPTLVQAHSLCTLSVALTIGAATGCPVLYDAHELETSQGQPWWRRPLDRWQERRLISRPEAMLVVSESIADWYAAAYSMPRPTVVRNIPDARVQTDATGSRVLRDRFAIPDDAIVFLYQGALAPGRRIEQLLRVFARARPDRHLVLMGYGVLEATIVAAASASANIHFMPAVAPAEVLRHTASADVGICGGENVCLSYYYSLPNKLFEYLLAGLPLMVPDWPEMRRVVDDYACGWVVDESDSAWLERLEAIDRHSLSAVGARARAAATHFSWEREERELLRVYRTLLGAGDQ